MQEKDEEKEEKQAAQTAAWEAIACSVLKIPILFKAG